MINDVQKKKLEQVFEKIGVKTAYLFGSQAREKTTALSDFDIAVEFKNSGDNFNKKLKLLSEINKIIHTDSVDLVDFVHAPLLLKYRIFKDGLLLYCENELERTRNKAMILSQYFDRKYYLDRHTKLSLEQIAQKGIL